MLYPVLISHLVWTLLCVLLILSLLGVAHTNQTINLRQGEQIIILMIITILSYFNHVHFE